MTPADAPFLSLTIFLPLVGVLAILALRGLARRDDAEIVARQSRWAALWVSATTFLISLILLGGFDPLDPGFQFVEEAAWLGGGVNYKVGVDGISLSLILLTTALTPLCILASFKVEKRVADYMIAFLTLETLMIGVFAALDLVVFYVFFEGGLIPMFLIIGIWGGKRRVYSAFKFFLYTFLGSVLMLVAILWMYVDAGTTDIPTLLAHEFPAGAQTWLWLAFFASFAVKMPMWPVHTWLPDAHVEAPTAGSMVLAGVLLKMGGYGFLRFSLPMFPEASADFTPLVFALSAIAIVYGSLVAFAQEDMKKLVAYSSVAHMGFVTMGIFAGNEVGVQGAVFQMISHGLVSAALFMCVGVVYDRAHTREIKALGGLAALMPVYAGLFMLFTMGNVGLPGTSGFIGEITTIAGVFGVSSWTAAFAALGVILSAMYALTLYRAVMFRDLKTPEGVVMTDASAREIVILAPLAAGVLIFGVYPSAITDLTAASVGAMIADFQAVLAAR